MKLIIAGGRDYNLTDADYQRLDDLAFGGGEDGIRIDQVISGGAKGADKCGEIWAMERGIHFTRVLANWDKYGKRAGPIRNAVMASKANAVVLFPGGDGTASMFEEATKAGIKIYDWRKPKQ